jgi:hypothetical protein
LAGAFSGGFDVGHDRRDEENLRAGRFAAHRRIVKHPRRRFAANARKTAYAPRRCSATIAEEAFFWSDAGVF